MMPILLAFSFFIGFLIESMVGLGGTLIAYSFLLFFVDIKSLIISTIILPIIASFMILLSDVKSIPLKMILKNTIICLFGVVLGLLLFNYLSSAIILKVLAVFLIVFGVRSLLFGEIIIKGLLGKLIVFISGIVHGLVGTGGPVAIIGMKDEFKNKAELRVGLALFFILLNIFRIIQLSFSNNVADFFVNVWVALPLIAGILIGNYLHKKISEKAFKKMLSIFFMIAGFLLLFR
jgi:uncharacterized membrane protein YfcA